MKYSFQLVAACNMCGSSKYRVLGRRLNAPQGLRPKNRTGISITVVQCTVCGLIYSQPLPVPAKMSDHYGIEPESYWNDDYFQVPENQFGTEIKRIKELAPHTSNFLDIGAGIGKTMKAVEPHFRAYGIEPSEPFYRRAVEQVGIDASRLKLVSMEDADFPDEFFDCVSFGVVLEHLYDPSRAIAKALKWLKPDGLVHIEVPDANYLFNRLFNLYFWLARTDFVVNISPMHTPFHLYEFTAKSFKLNGKINGYGVRHIDRYAGTTPVAPGFSKLMAPIMKWTNTGVGLVLYLQKR